MLDRLVGFIDRLRTVGVPVSTSEALDASRALLAVEMTNRAHVKVALASAMTKTAAHRSVFDSLFEIYFPESVPDLNLLLDDETPPDDLAEHVLDALRRMDLDELDRLAMEAVRRYAGMEPGRPVGGRYYQWRVEQALQMEQMAQMLTDMLGGGRGSGQAAASGIGGAVASADADSRVAEFRRRVERIIRSRLIQERGPDAMARALVRPLPEDVEFLQATSDELGEMRRTVELLARRLAARLAYKHHRSSRGRLDFRRTIRRSLSNGGVPIDTVMTHRVQRPEIVVLCDVSGSVAAFSRFALALLYALSQHFRKIRSFAFVDTVDEVTRFFESGDLQEAVRRVKTEARVVWLDGHSDYGHSLKTFVEEHSDAITPRTTVLLLGDVRSNFRNPETWALSQIREKARKLYLLNPEPHRHWDTGDSIVSRYEPFCDAVTECRNLRQLAAFIEKIG